MIASFLDQDLYKFTTQQAVLQYFGDARATYRFINRNPKQCFNNRFLTVLQHNIDNLVGMRITSQELSYLDSMSLFQPWYLKYLESYRYQKQQLDIRLYNNALEIDINGPWHSAVLWEVPLMALISESFFRTCDTNWTLDGQEQKILDKINELGKIRYTDFGTRRRRSYDTQDLVVRNLAKANRGTSNVHLAKLYDTICVGTFPHEWVMAHSALVSHQHANYFALKNWADFYQGKLGIALTDTFGTDSFFRDFNLYLAKLYDGLRQDSKDPMEFFHKAVRHYEKLHMDPRYKDIVFSDGLTTRKVVNLEKEIDGRTKTSYGIGTHFTNDFENSPPLNMVIKLASINDIPVAKLSDDPSKACGDRDAIRIAKYFHMGQPLDE